MKYYFAPLEGIARYYYRNLHHQFFPGIDRYYSPFVVTRDGGIMKQKELWDILPENNEGICLIPQILTNSAENFLQTSHQMKELGYDEVNLNLGCPSGTVTGKGRGAGFLRFDRRGDLQRFLDEIFAHAEPQISVKSRIGWEEPEEFQALLQLFNEYPIQELILHPRTRSDFYRGHVHREVFAYAYEHSKNPLCYNGDINTIEDYQSLCRDFPNLQSVMIGRGLLADPGLVSRIQGKSITKSRFLGFYEAIFQKYHEILDGDAHLLQKMKELWVYMAVSFTNYENYLKKIKKAKKVSEYQIVVQQLLQEQELNFYS